MLAGQQPKADDSAIKTPIKTSLNIADVVDDKVPVVINPGRFSIETVTYRLPYIIPGTYSVSDFGKYVENFKALDYNGNELAFNKVDTNTWTIADATKLDKITYNVNDTFDIETSGGIGGEQPFSPAGTNIELNNFVLNLHGFIGYFDSLKNNQYTLDVTAPADFVRTSAFQETAVNKSADGKTVTHSYYAPRYFDITDNPMMYGDLDVEEFMVDDIKIVLSVYSPNKVHSAKSLKETIAKMMKAQKAYLGDMDATPRYDIYLYLSEGKEDSPKGFGALEHFTSTVVVMPEASSQERLAESMTDIVSHEFFHTVTPLSVHSEDIHYFDFHKPTFSKHLWMYEGFVEYFATHFQLKEDLVDDAEFYTDMMDKINVAKNFDDSMSFTIMSENILDAPYKDNYLNVYYKGALIGMCVDILMRKESNGQRSVLSLMKELSNKYGKDKPFTDDNFIAEVTEMTYPSVGKFLQTHVVGDLPINYNDYFDMVGLEVGETEVETNYIFAGGQNFIFAGDPSKGILFREDAMKNSFWKSQNIQAGDVVKKINGEDLTLQNAQEKIQKMLDWKKGDNITMDIERNGQPITIEATLTKATAIGEGLVLNPNATEAQVKLRESWLRG